MHKITNSERNRVVSILDDSIERIMLLSYVPERAHEAVLAELEPGPYDVFSRHWDGSHWTAEVWRTPVCSSDKVHNR